MLASIIGALKSVIDLLRGAKEDKKVQLEIQKLEAELDDNKRLVRPATFAEVEKYDPKVSDIRAQFQPRPAPSPPPTKRPPILLMYVVVPIGGSLLIYWLVKLLVRWFN
jgi:hypothetical protein